MIQGGSLVAEIRPDRLRTDGPSEESCLGLHRRMVLESAGGWIFAAVKLSTLGERIRQGIAAGAEGVSGLIALGRLRAAAVLCGDGLKVLFHLLA